MSAHRADGPAREKAWVETHPPRHRREDILDHIEFERVGDIVVARVDGRPWIAWTKPAVARNLAEALLAALDSDALEVEFGGGLNG